MGPEERAYQKSRFKNWMKIVSILAIGVFMSQQVAWAYGGPVSAPVVDGPGRLSDISIPQDIGTTRETVDTGSDETIIHIQDAHASLSAQESIVNILDNLLTNYDMNVVAVEGSSGYIDTSFLSTFPIDDIKRKAAHHFMEQGKLSAGEFFAVCSKAPIALYGVENRDFYEENLEAFMGLWHDREKLLKHIEALGKALQALEKEIYTEEILALNNNAALHGEGKLGFGEYWEYLSKAAEGAGLRRDGYDNISALLDIIAREKEIDFTKANEERDGLIDDFNKRLKKEDLQELVMKSLSFKLNKTGKAEYYSYLRQLSLKARIDIKQYRNLSSYIEYVTRHDGINMLALFGEIDDFEEALRQKFFTDDDQRALHKLSKNLAITGKVFNLELIPVDFEYYLAQRDEFQAEVYAGLFSQVCRSAGLPVNRTTGQQADIQLIFSRLPEAMKFYYAAQKRDSALIRNTIERMKAEGKKVAALVTGGFHTDGMTDILKSKKLSYLVVMPKMEEGGKERPYIAVLTNRSQPYKELIKTGDFHIAVGSFFAESRSYSREEVRAFLEEIGNWIVAELYRQNTTNVAGLIDRWVTRLQARQAALQEDGHAIIGFNADETRELLTLYASRYEEEAIKAEEAKGGTARKKAAARRRRGREIEEDYRSIDTVTDRAQGRARAATKGFIRHLVSQEVVNSVTYAIDDEVRFQRLVSAAGYDEMQVRNMLGQMGEPDATQAPGDTVTEYDMEVPEKPDLLRGRGRIHHGYTEEEVEAFEAEIDKITADELREKFPNYDMIMGLVEKRGEEAIDILAAHVGLLKDAGLSDEEIDIVVLALAVPGTYFTMFETKVEGAEKYICGTQSALGIDLIKYLLHREVVAGEENLVLEDILHEALENTSLTHNQIITLTTKLLHPEDKELIAELEANEGNPDADVRGRTALGKEVRGFINAKAEIGENPALVSDEDEALILSEPPAPAPVDIGRADEALEAIASTSPAETGADYSVIADGDNVVVVSYGQRELSEAQQTAIEREGRDRRLAERIDRSLGRDMYEKLDFAKDAQRRPGEVERMLKPVIKDETADLTKATARLQRHFGELAENWRRCGNLVLALDMIMRSSQAESAEEFLAALDANRDSLREAYPALDGNAYERLKHDLELRFGELMEAAESGYKDAWIETVFDALYSEWHRNSLLDAVQLTYLDEAVPVYDENGLTPEGDTMQPLGWSPEAERRVEELVREGKRVTLLLGGMHHPGVTRFLFEGKALGKAEGSLIVAGVRKDRAGESWLYHKPEHAVFASREGLSYPAGLVEATLNNPFISRQLSETDGDRDELGRQLAEEETLDELDDGWQDYSLELAGSVVSRLKGEEEVTTESITAALAAAVGEDIGPARGPQVADRLTHRLDIEGKMIVFEKAVRAAVRAANQGVDKDRQNAESEMAEMVVDTIPPMPARRKRMLGRLAPTFGEAGVAATLALAFLGPALTAGQAVAGEEATSIDLPDMPLEMAPEGAGLTGEDRFLDTPVESILPRRPGEAAALPDVREKPRVSPQRVIEIGEERFSYEALEALGLAVEDIRHLQKGMLMKSGEVLQVRPEYAGVVRDFKMRMWRKRYISDVEKEYAEIEAEEVLDVARAHQALAGALADYIDAISGEISPVEGVPMHLRKEAAWRGVVDSINRCFAYEGSYWKRLVEVEEDLLEHTKKNFRKGYVPKPRVDDQEAKVAATRRRHAQIGLMREVYMDLAKLNAPMLLFQIMENEPVINSIWEALPPIVGRSDLPRSEQLAAVQRIKNSLKQILDGEAAIMQTDIEVGKRYLEWGEGMYEKGFRSGNWIELERQTQERRENVGAARIALIKEQQRAMDDLELAQALDMPIFRQLGTQAISAGRHSELMVDFFEKSEGLYMRFPLWGRGDYLASKFNAGQSRLRARSSDILAQMAHHYKALGFPATLPETGKFVRGAFDAQQTMPDEANPLPRVPTREEIEYHTGWLEKLHKQYMDLVMTGIDLWADWNTEVCEYYLNSRFSSEGQKDNAVHGLNLVKLQRLETALLEGERRLLDLEEGTPEYDKAVEAYENTVMELLHERLRFVDERIPHMEKRVEITRKAGLEGAKEWYGSEGEGLRLVRDMIEMQIEWFENIRRMNAPVGHPNFAPRVVISVQEIQRLTERLLAGKPRAGLEGWVRFIDENDEERLERVIAPGKIALGKVIYRGGFGRFMENVIYVDERDGARPAENIIKIHADCAGFLTADDPFSINNMYVQAGGPVLRLDMASGDYVVAGMDGFYTMDPQPMLVGVDPDSPSGRPRFMQAFVLYKVVLMEIDLRDGRTVKRFQLYPKKVIIRTSLDMAGREGLSTLGTAEDNMPIVAEARDISEGDPLHIVTEEGWKELSLTPVDVLHPERVRKVQVKNLKKEEAGRAVAARARKFISGLAMTNRHIDMSSLNELADSHPHMAVDIAEGLARTFNSVGGEIMRMIPDEAISSPEALEEIAATGRMPTESKVEVTVRDKYVDVALTTPAVSRSVPVRRSGDGKLDSVSLGNACSKIGGALNTYAMSVETNAFNRCYANYLEIRTSGIEMSDPGTGHRAVKAVKKGIDTVNLADRGIIGNASLGGGTRKIHIYERDGAVKVHIEGVTRRDDPISVAADDLDNMEDALWREVAAAHIKFSLLSNAEQAAWGGLLIAGEAAGPEQQFRDALRLHLGINQLVSEEERPKYSAQLRYIASLLEDGREGLAQRQGMMIDQGFANVKSNASMIVKLSLAAGLVLPVIGFGYNALIGERRARRRRGRQERQSLDSFKSYDLRMLERIFFKGRDFGLDSSLKHPASRIRFTSQSRFGDTYDVKATLTPAIKNVPESLTDRAENVPFDSLESAIAIRDRLRRERGFAVEDTGVVEVDTTYGPQHMARVRIDGKWQYLTLAPVSPQVSGDRITALTDDQAEALRESRRREGTVISGDQQILSSRREGDESSLKRTVVTTFSVDVAREDSGKARLQPDDEIVLTLHAHLVTDGWKRDRKLILRRSAREIAGMLAMPKAQQRKWVARYLTEHDIGLLDITAEDETALNRAVTEQTERVTDLLAKLDIPESVQPVVRRVARPKGKWLDRGGIKFNARGQVTLNIPEAAGEELRQIVGKFGDAVTGIGNDERFVRKALRGVNVRIFEGLASPAELSGSEKNNVLRLDSRLFAGLGDTEVRFILRHVIAPALAGMRGEKELLEKQFPSALTLTPAQRDRIEKWVRKTAGEEWPAVFAAELGKQLASAKISTPAKTRRAAKAEKVEGVPVTLRHDTSALWEEEMTVEEVIKNTEELFREGEMLERFSEKENEGLKEQLDGYLAALKALPAGTTIEAILDGADEDMATALHQINDEFLWYARKIGKVEVLGAEDPRVAKAIEFYETVTEGMGIDVAAEIRRLAEEKKLSAVARIKGIPIRGHASEEYGINVITSGSASEEAEDITALVHEIGVMLGLEHTLNHELETACSEFIEGPLAGGTIAYLQEQLEDAETGIKLTPDGRVAMIDTGLKRVDVAALSRTGKPAAKPKKSTLEKLIRTGGMFALAGVVIAVVGGVIPGGVDMGDMDGAEWSPPGGQLDLAADMTQPAMPAAHTGPEITMVPGEGWQLSMAPEAGPELASRTRPEAEEPEAATEEGVTEDTKMRVPIVVHMRMMQEAMLLSGGLDAIVQQQYYQDTVVDFDRKKAVRGFGGLTLEAERSEVEAWEGLNVAIDRMDLLFVLTNYMRTVGENINAEDNEAASRKKEAWQDVVKAVDDYFESRESYWRGMVAADERQAERDDKIGGAATPAQQASWDDERVEARLRLQNIQAMHQVCKNLMRLNGPALVFKMLPAGDEFRNAWEALPPLYNPEPERMSRKERLFLLIDTNRKLQAVLLGKMLPIWAKERVSGRYRDDVGLRNVRGVESDAERERVDREHGILEASNMLKTGALFDQVELLEKMNMRLARLFLNKPEEGADDFEPVDAVAFKRLAAQVEIATGLEGLMGGLLEGSEALYRDFGLVSKTMYETDQLNHEFAKIRRVQSEILKEIAAHYKAMGWAIPIPETAESPDGFVDLGRVISPEPIPLKVPPTAEEIEHHTGAIRRLHLSYAGMELRLKSMTSETRAEWARWEEGFRFNSKADVADAIHERNLADVEQSEGGLMLDEMLLMALDDGTPDYVEAREGYEAGVLRLLEEERSRAEARFEEIDRRIESATKNGLAADIEYNKAEKEKLEYASKRLTAKIKWFEDMLALGGRVGHPDFAPSGTLVVQAAEGLTGRGAEQARLHGYAKVVGEDGKEKIVGVMEAGKMGLGNVVYDSGDRFGENVIYVYDEEKEGWLPASQAHRVFCDRVGFLSPYHPYSVGYAYIQTEGPVPGVQLPSSEYMVIGMEGFYTMGEPILVGVDPESPAHETLYIIANTLYEAEYMATDLRDGRTVERYNLYPEKVIVRTSADMTGEEGFEPLGETEDGFPIMAEPVDINTDNPFIVRTAEGFKALVITTADVLHPSSIQRVELVSDPIKVAEAIRKAEVHTLVESLENEDPLIRAAAAEKLGEMEATDALQALRQLLEKETLMDENENVIKSARNAISRVEPLAGEEEKKKKVEELGTPDEGEPERPELPLPTMMPARRDTSALWEEEIPLRDVLDNEFLNRDEILEHIRDEKELLEQFSEANPDVTVGEILTKIHGEDLEDALNQLGDEFLKYSHEVSKTAKAIGKIDDRALQAKTFYREVMGRGDIRTEIDRLSGEGHLSAVPDEFGIPIRGHASKGFGINFVETVNPENAEAEIKEDAATIVHETGVMLGLPHNINHRLEKAYLAWMDGKLDPAERDELRELLADHDVVKRTADGRVVMIDTAEELGMPEVKRMDVAAVSRARELGRAVGEWWQGTGPLRGTAEGYYDINRLNKEGLSTALRSAEINAAFAEAGTKPLTQQQINFHAPRLIERRPGLLGYRRDADIREALKRGRGEGAIPKPARIASKQAEVIAGFFQRGITRRPVILGLGVLGLGVVAAGVATTAAVVGGGKKDEVAEKKEPATEEGEVAICLGFHGEAADVGRVLAELRATEGAKKRIFFGESAPISLDELREDHPDVTEKITLERLYQLITLLKEHEDLWLLNWSQGDEGDPELRELASGLIRAHHGNSAILSNEQLVQMVREDPSLLKMLDDVPMGDFLRPILEYAVENKDLEIVFEKAPLICFLHYILSEMIEFSATRRLYADRNEVMFAREMVVAELGERIAHRIRESAYAGLLSERLSREENRGARAVVQMGAYHKGVVAKIGEIPGFKVKTAEAQQRFIPWMEFSEQHLDELASVETDDDYQALLNRNRREFLSCLVYDAIYTTFSGKGIGTLAEIERADEVFADLTLEDLEKITAFLQEKSKVIGESGTIGVRDWDSLLCGYVVAWIHENKKELSERVKGRMAKVYRDLTIEAMDAKVKRLASGDKSAATDIYTPGPYRPLLVLAAAIEAAGAAAGGEGVSGAQIASGLEQRIGEVFKPEDYGYYNMLRDPRSRIAFTYSEATDRLEMVLQCERQLGADGLYVDPAGYNCIDGVRNLARWVRDEGVACGVHAVETPARGIHYYVKAADGTQFSVTPEYARVNEGFADGVELTDEAVEARFRLHAEGIELFRQGQRGYPESDVFMGWSPLADGGSLTRNANVLVNYGGNEARLVFRHRLSCIVDGQGIGGKVFEITIPANRLVEVQEALRALGPDGMTEESLGAIDGLALEVRNGPMNRALEAVWSEVEAESERTIDAVYHLIAKVDAGIVPSLEEQFARAGYARSEAAVETRRPRIVIPAFENRDRLVEIVSEAIQARSYPLRIEVVADSDTTDGVAIVEGLSQQGNRLNLLIDTDDEAVVAEMINPILDELDVNMLLLNHPGLTVRGGSAVRREVLTQLTQDRRLLTVIRSGEAAYALSRAIRMELSGCGRFSYYAYSERARALSRDNQKMIVIPSSVLEGNIARGLRASIANRQMQMGGIEGEDPIGDVLVITDPTITSDLQVSNYLTTFELDALLDRSRVITHQEIAERCPGQEMGNLAELEIKAIISQIMQERGLEVADEADMEILGGTEGLVSMLIQGILTGIEPGQEARYEEAIERLVNNGELDPKVAQQLNESKDLLINQDAPEYETYRSEIQNLKQRLDEAIATDFSA